LRISEFLTKNVSLIDALSKIAQILALLLAGLWTYKTFYEADRPALEPRLNTSNAVYWAAIPGDHNNCEATLSVTVQNTGRQSVDVTAVEVAGWLSDPISTRGTDPTLIVGADLVRGKKFIDGPVPSKILIGHYPPGTSRTDSFVWYFANEQGKVVSWEVDYQTSRPTQFPSNTYFWSYVCLGLPEPDPTQPR
jgi:hypothetical protein